MHSGEQKSLEEKKPTSLVYLNKLNPRERSKLEAKFEKSLPELDAILCEYWKNFRSRQLIFTLSLCSWGPAIFFQAKRGSSGLNGLLANTFDFTIADDAAYWIGMILAIGGNVTYTLSYSPFEKAIDSSIRYAGSPPLRDRLKSKIDYAFDNRLKAAGHVTKELLLLATNSTGALMPVLGFVDEIKSLSPFIKVLVVSSMAVPQYIFYKIYFREDEGMEYIFGENQCASLYSLLMNEGEIALPVKIFIQGMLSSVILRSFPFYFYLAEKSVDFTQGYFFPVLQTVSGNLLQGLLVYYVKVAKHYLENRVLIEDKIRKKHADSLASLTREAEMKNTHATSSIIKTLRKEYIAEFDSKQKRFYAFKNEPNIAVEIAYWMYCGGMLGYKLAPMIYESPWVTALSTIMSSLSCGEIVRRSEMQRVKERMFLEDWEQKENPQLAIKHRATRCEKFVVDGVGNALVISTGLSTLITTMGTLDDVSENLTSAIAIFAVQRMLCTVLYNSTVKETLRNRFFSPSAKVYPLQEEKDDKPEEDYLSEKGLVLTDRRALPANS